MITAVRISEYDCAGCGRKLMENIVARMFWCGKCHVVLTHEEAIAQAYTREEAPDDRP